jgi:hypothetical protein
MRFLAVLAALLFLASSACIVAAGIEIESIVATGPIAAIVGLLAAIPFAWVRRWPLAAASLTLPLIAVLVFSLIAGNGWGPPQARRPVMVVLLGYELLVAPLWLGGLLRIVRGAEQRPGKLQFPLRGLMIVMLIVAVALGAGRLAMRLSPTLLLAVAVSLFVALACALCWLAFQALFVESPRPKSAPAA